MTMIPKVTYLYDKANMLIYLKLEEYSQPKKDPDPYLLKMLAKSFCTVYRMPEEGSGG